ncbi:LOW QUALITY PROTEIN: riboflavin transporter MCH5 [Aspergillus udagawae]|uniref:Riboflavin transporter MCH5 n=1 Tax=Aspergillus udagawae TaxID=91492 RepID=A0A8H3NXH6_9EURO|nr:LOW QUALITY PROTEIN: riboflavin transporter MCH5 [Aspergillus udagawae]
MFSVRESCKEESIIQPPKAPETAPFPDGGARAWMVALGAGGVLFCTFGYVNAFGVYQAYYITHQLSQYSAADIAWIGSVQTFFLFGSGLVGGPLFDRYGAKAIWAPAVLVIFSVMLTSLCTKFYQFFLAQGILGGISMGLSLAPVLSSTAQYFQKKRAAAMGISIAGSSLGGVIFPIALEQMVYSSLGFAWAVRIVGFVILGVMSCAGSARLPPKKQRFLKVEAFKKTHYIATLTAVFFLNVGIFTPFFYLPLYGESHGMSTSLAFYLIAIQNASSFFGRLVPGVIADKIGPYNMLSTVSIITAIITFCWIRMTTDASNIVFSVLYGFFSGGIIGITPAAIANCAGHPQEIGTYIGMGMAVMSAATLIGPPINGALLNNYGDFLQVQIFSAAVMMFGGILAFVAKMVAGKKALAKG